MHGHTIRGASLIALALAVLTPQSAAAQPSDPPQPTDSTPGHTSPAAPSDPKLEEAKQRFRQGIALAKQGNCEGALGEFEASLALAPRPSTLYNIGQCNETLFRYARAVDAYKQYLATAAQDDPDRRAVEATIRSLKNLLGTVNVKSNTPGTIWIGNRKVGQSPGTVLVPGGRHALEVRSDGYLTARREIDVAGRKTITVSLTLTKASKKVFVTNVEKRGLNPAVFWTGVTATVVAAGIGVGFGLHAQSSHNSAENIDPRLPRDDKADTIKRSARIADILFLTSGVLAIGTTVTYFLTKWDKPERKKATVAPSVSTNSVGIVVQGAL